MVEWIYDGDCMITSCCNTAYDINKFEREGELIYLPLKCPNCGCELRAKEHYKNETNTLCDCWLFDYGNRHHYCNNTKEREICYCDGDVKKCDFYPKKRGEQK